MTLSVAQEDRTLASSAYYRDHWLQIEPDRLERYESMFQWNPASANLFEPADVQAGHVVGDFGCGPGHMAVELAGWVGAAGHVHAFDINAEFVSRARERAAAAGLGERITVHLLAGAELPLPAASLDRMLARNTLVYVDDPQVTLAEFRRVVRPGGKAHMIEGDWGLTFVEPIPPEEWQALVAAASHAFRTPLVGRKLPGLARRSGFAGVALKVIANPDSGGRLLGMVRNLAGYAREGGRLDPARIDAVLEIAETAARNGDFLALTPQFVVTATVG
jgi:ubiquinone/menaquinone biosynthesis C-methylase UbiE